MNKTQWKLNRIQKKLLHSVNNENNYSTHKAIKEIMLSKNPVLQQIIKALIKKSEFIYSTKDLIALNKVNKIPKASPYTLFVCTDKKPRPLNILEGIGFINVIKNKLNHKQAINKKSNIERKRPNFVKKLSHYKLFKKIFNYYYNSNRYNFFIKMIVKIAFAIIFTVLMDLLIYLISDIIRMPIKDNNIYVLIISLVVGCYFAIKYVTIDINDSKRKH